MAGDETRKVGRDQIMKEPAPWKEACFFLLEQCRWPLEGYVAMKEVAPEFQSLTDTSVQG